MRKPNGNAVDVSSVARGMLHTDVAHAGTHRSRKGTEVSTIYAQIGGAEALETVVDDFYDRVLGDAELAGFFSGTNLARLKGKQVEFFSAALGGPAPYSGPSMREVHQGRGIAMHHFNLVAMHLSNTLEGAGIPAQIVEQILAAIAPLADDIVTAKSA
jgi:hemoglobin